MQFAVIDTQTSADFGLTCKVSDTGVDLPPFGNQLADEEARNIAAATLYENLP